MACLPCALPCSPAPATGVVGLFVLQGSVRQSLQTFAESSSSPDAQRLHISLLHREHACWPEIFIGQLTHSTRAHLSAALPQLHPSTSLSPFAESKGFLQQARNPEMGGGAPLRTPLGTTDESPMMCRIMVFGPDWCDVCISHGNIYEAV